MKRINSDTKAQDLWSISGSFEPLFGEICEKDGTICAQRQDYSLCMRQIKAHNGVNMRFDTFTNNSQKTLYITDLLSKFTFDGGEYEVYTQFDGWCDESKGAWQPLTTSVSAGTVGTWMTINATPMLALWNNQTSRGTVFHIISDCAWQISASKKYAHDDCACITVEAGLNRHNLMMEVKPGESVEFPEIIYYDFKNKTDLDCHKLHEAVNKKYPRRHMAVAFNTWLCDFQKITFESVTKQIKPAADIGAEYFIIDAGWFYKDADGWNTSRGDWAENDSYGLCGRMGEIAELVRKSGMKFGFWIEPVAAGNKADILKTHGEYFILENGKYLLDFTNPAAVDHITNVTLGLIEKYKAEFIKFDFNQEITYDMRHSAFRDYCKGMRQYYSRIKNAHPEVHLEGCAGGGANMGLHTLPYFDSYWISDNQSVFNSLRIFKDTILRMPPQMIEKWISVGCYADFPSTVEQNTHNKILTTDDATFNHVREVKPDFLEGFMQGGPIGLSCDLTRLTPDTYTHIKNVIAKFKAEREFWQNAVCRILTDTPTMLVLQFCDTRKDKIKLLVYSLRSYQDSLRVYPVVESGALYKKDGAAISADTLFDEGIEVEIKGKFRYTCIDLDKVK